MKQVRMCWNDEVSRLKRETITSGYWAEATSALVHYYEILAQAGNEIFGPGTHWSELRDVPEDEALPEVAVRDLIDQSMRAWIDGNMQEHVRYFTPSAILVTPTGECHRGRAAMLRAFESEQAAMPGLKMTPESIEIIHPAQNTAVVLMKGAIWHSGLKRPERWASTQVTARTVDEGWRIASLQVFHPR